MGENNEPGIHWIRFVSAFHDDVGGVGGFGKRDSCRLVVTEWVGALRLGWVPHGHQGLFGKGKAINVDSGTCQHWFAVVGNGKCGTIVGQLEIENRGRNCGGEG